MTVERLKMILDDLVDRYPTATVKTMRSQVERVWVDEIALLDCGKIVALINVEDGRVLTDPHDVAMGKW